MSVIGHATQPQQEQGASHITLFTNPQYRNVLLKFWSIAAVFSFAISLYFALVYAGTDVTMGNVQRVFYMHVSAFAGAAVAFFVTVVAGIAYLRTRNRKWDTLGLAGVEVGLMLSVITLVTGSIWARPTWNTWWTWDPRLTSAAIMALTYAAYMMLRNGIEMPERQRTFSAVYGILAFSTVIFTFMITRMRGDTIHPNVIGSSPVNAKGTFEMVDNMRVAFSVNMWAWCAFIAPVLIWWRVRLQNVSITAEKRRADFLNDNN
jgi:heme exporter protein C